MEVALVTVLLLSHFTTSRDQLFRITHCPSLSPKSQFYYAPVNYYRSGLREPAVSIDSNVPSPMIRTSKEDSFALMASNIIYLRTSEARRNGNQTCKTLHCHSQGQCILGLPLVTSILYCLSSLPDLTPLVDLECVWFHVEWVPIVCQITGVRSNH